MSIRAFIKSDPAYTAGLIIAACIGFNGISVAWEFANKVYDDYEDSKLTDIVELIDNTHDINRKLELMNILRDACIANPKWKDLDEDSTTYTTCNWAMGTEL